jgi:MtrB/PioB family decaheme-associated outer membrane protein
MLSFADGRDMHMRRTHVLLLTGLLLAPAAARAQQPAAGTQAPAATPTADVDTGEPNFIDFIGRGTIFAAGSDEARFQRYRDLRDGGTADVFRLGRDTSSYRYTVQADHIGYRDQRYSASYNNFGKLKVAFEWNQIPLYFSNTTAALYTEAAPGVLLMDDKIQTGLQTKVITLGQAVSQAQPFDLRLQRDILSMNLTYSATRNLDLNVLVRNTTKTGNQPWAGTFGFSNAVELAVPVDTRTTELGSSVEWTNSRGLARVGYDGSFFRNNTSTLVWDNPLRITDSTTAGPVQGRMDLWPNSNMNAANATGVLKLPHNSQAMAYISVGNWTQNDALIPFTINSVLPVIPLDRATADAKAVVTAMTYSFTSKPTDALWFNARYRSYDFDNQTPVFHVTNTISYDTTPAAFADGGTSPYSYKRRTFDADASYSLTSFTALRLGYTHEQLSQTFRFVDQTDENTVRVSADATGLPRLSLRAVYEYAKRVGTGVDEQALDDIGEQTSLRQFDLSDRTTHRVSAIAQVMATSSLSFNGSVSAGNDQRPQDAFGLLSNDSRGYSVGLDFVPSNAVSFGMSYTFEKYLTNQKSRQANPGPQFDDPTRDWTTDANDKAHTVAASLDLIKLFPKTDIRFAYNYSDARSTYIYGLTPDTTLPPVQQLPSVNNVLQRGTADLRYYFTTRLSGGFAYWFDKYNVNDFALQPQTSLAQPSFLTMGYYYAPYTANTLIGRLTYYW